VPDESTVRKLTRRLGPEMVHEITRELIGKARREKRFRPRAARIDSTVVEADVRYPTDAGLADAGVRALAREGRKLAVKIKEKRTAVRDRSRAIGRKLRALTRSIRRRSGEAKAEVLELTAQTGKLLERSVREARTLAATARARARGRGARAKLKAARALQELADRCEKVTEQINKRVAGEPIKDRLISLWDPDARPIRKGKLGKPNEFGYVDQLCEITANTKKGARGFILPPTSEIGNPAEDTLLPDTAHELRNLGIKLKEIMVDGAFTTTATNNALEDLADTVHIAGPPRGRLAAHPPPPTTLPHRDGGTGQPPQTRLRAAPQPPQRRRRPPDLGWMGDPHLQRRDLHHPLMTPHARGTDPGEAGQRTPESKTGNRNPNRLANAFTFPTPERAQAFIRRK